MSARKDIKPIVRKPAKQPKPVEVVPAPAAETAAAEAIDVKAEEAVSHISSARVRRIIDKYTINKQLDEKIKDNESKIQQWKDAKDDLARGAFKTQEAYEETVKTTVEGVETTKVEKKTKEVLVPLTDIDIQKLKLVVSDIGPLVGKLVLESEALSREKTRFSLESSLTLAIVFDNLVCQVAEHAIKKVLSTKKKIVQIEHIHSEGLSQIPLYPLLKSLGLFIKTQASIDSAVHAKLVAAHTAATRTAALREFKAKYADVLPKKPKAVKPKPAEPAAPADEEELLVAEPVDETKDSFKHYITNVCKSVIDANAAFAGIRFSSHAKIYISELLVELIVRLAPLILRQIEAMNIKTVNVPAILTTIELLLIDGHKPSEVIEMSTEKIPDPLLLRKEFEKKDQAKKEGQTYKVSLESVPKVDGYVVTRKFTYPSAKFEQLSKDVEHKIKLYKSLKKESPALAPATV